MSRIPNPLCELPTRSLILTCMIGFLMLAVGCGQPQSMSPNSTDSATSQAKSVEPGPIASQPQTTASPSTTPAIDTIQESLMPPHYGAATASVERRIFDADVIVRASLLATSEGQLQFKAIEYLKGTGPSKFVVGAPTFGRDPTWDNREAVLFLSKAESGVVGASDALRTDDIDFTFVETADENYRGALPSGYTIDARNPVWLPAREDGVSDALVDGVVTPMFITGLDYVAGSLGAEISLSELRSKIAWVGGGKNIEGYDRCIGVALNYYQWYRDWEAYYGSAPTILGEEREVKSGETQGTEIYASQLIREPGYHTVRIRGEDGHLVLGRKEDNDQDPSNGYRITVKTARPLPQGLYRFSTQYQLYDQVPCNFQPEPGKGQLDWVVQALAPTGAVHEAFFDPVAIGESIGVSAGVNGVLSPTSFTLTEGGSTNTLHKIAWKSGKTTMEFEPSASLAGHHADFLSLDGSVSLRLDFDDGSESVVGAKRTITWNVCKQPWESGNLLMLRISKSSSNLTGVTNDGPCEENSE